VITVRLTDAYRGPATREQWYGSGSVLTLDDSDAQYLIGLGRAVAVVVGIDLAQDSDQSVVVDLPLGGSARKRRRAADDEE
jgi:hypothetical protein